MSLELDMRHCRRMNRSEAVSLDSAVVRIQEQATEKPDDYRFTLHRPTLESFLLNKTSFHLVTILDAFLQQYFSFVNTLTQRVSLKLPRWKL